MLKEFLKFFFQNVKVKQLNRHGWLSLFLLSDIVVALWVNICVDTHIYINTHIHTYINTYIHTYIHIYMSACTHSHKNRMGKYV